MKRVFVIFLTTLYLVFSSGFTTYTHLCNGLRQQTGLSEQWKTQVKNCKHCKSNNVPANSRNCCKQELKVYKLEEKSQLAKQLNIKYKWAGDVLPHRFFGHVFDLGLFTSLNYTNSPFDSSLLSRSNPLYIFFCVYRI